MTLVIDLMKDFFFPLKKYDANNNLVSFRIKDFNYYLTEEDKLLDQEEDCKKPRYFEARTDDDIPYLNEVVYEGDHLTLGSYTDSEYYHFNGECTYPTRNGKLTRRQFIRCLEHYENMFENGRPDHVYWEGLELKKKAHLGLTTRPNGVLKYTLINVYFIFLPVINPSLTRKK